MRNLTFFSILCTALLVPSLGLAYNHTWPSWVGSLEHYHVAPETPVLIPEQYNTPSWRYMDLLFNYSIPQRQAQSVYREPAYSEPWVDIDRSEWPHWVGVPQWVK